jgi:hypothetical protein
MLDGMISRTDGLILLLSYYPYFKGTDDAPSEEENRRGYRRDRGSMS